MGSWKRSRRRAREGVLVCVVSRTWMVIQWFVGGGGRGGGRLLGGLLCRVGTLLGVVVCAVGCDGRVG